MYKKKIKGIFSIKLGHVKGNWEVIDSNPILNTNKFKCKCLSCGRIADVSTSYLLSKKKLQKYCIKCYREISHNNSNNIGTCTGSIPHRIYSRWKEGARSRNLEFKITKEYLNDLINNQKFKCNISGLDIKFEPKLIVKRDNNKKQLIYDSINTTASLDRIDSSKGYIEGNVQFLHKKVNTIKWNLDQSDFIDLCKIISANNP